MLLYKIIRYNTLTYLGANKYSASDIVVSSPPTVKQANYYFYSSLKESNNFPDYAYDIPT